MKIAIIGQQDFGKSVLDAFLARGDEVAGVFCAPEKEGAKPDALRVAAQESEAWVAAFEFLQMLRLQVQIGADPDAANPNLIDVATLNEIDRRMLKETVRIARRLQQRIELDYRR